MAVRTASSRTRVAPMMMDRAGLQFAISQLRMDKVIYDLHALVVSFLMVLTAVFLPEMLYRVVYGSGQTGADLSILSWIPVVAYSVAVLVTLFVLVSNWMRFQKIKRLERELATA